MLYIEKGPCPENVRRRIESLTGTPHFRALPEVPSKEQRHLLRDKFNSLNKSDIREALIAEQHGLCAYCMCRVVNHGGTTTIEHLMPLSKSKSGALNYANWMAVCKGGQNVKLPSGRRRILCCDARKSDQIISLNPMKKEQMDHIAYYEDGTIIYNAPAGPEREQITRDINEALALNGVVNPATGHSQRDTTTGIVKHRKDIYIAMHEYLSELLYDGTLTPAYIALLRQELLSDDPWEPYVGVKLYVLNMFEEVLTNP